MPTPRRLPTGPQYEISRGRARAKIGSVAAVLRGFAVDGVDFTEVWDDSRPAPYGCGIVLAPWPNRIADGTWTLDGRTMLLDLTDRSNNAAIHGLLRNTAYDLVSVDESSVTLGAAIYPQHGYPFTLDTLVTYALLDEGLTVTHRLVNVGEGTAPFGIGAHPYLKVGEHPVGDLRLQIDAASYLPIDERKAPTGREPVDGTPFDLRSGVRLGAADLDHCYADLTPAGDRHEARLTAPDGTGVLLWADLSFNYLQVFTPRDFPGRDLTVAIEPMTCPANAFNSGEALRHLAPGESFEASWGLHPFGAR